MKYYVVIPAYNEAVNIGQMLQSLAEQTILPAKAVVVDDNSVDETPKIISDFAEQHTWLNTISRKSNNVHMPGSKVIQAFLEGYQTFDNDYDIIVKLDADLILPPDYFEKIIAVFQQNKKAGIVGGFAYIQNNNTWILENLTSKDHVRGAFKAYRKGCFVQIGRLKPAMGWDTVDELLAKFYGWEVVTIPGLKVKHLKPTGKSYTKEVRLKQGEAFYTLGYGFIITVIAGAKLAILKKKPLLFIDYIKGFFKAKRENKPLLVTEEQARFIKKYRWNKIKERLF